MRELNIEFQENYKRLDKLFKEMYSSNEGVSAYIQHMERTPYAQQKNVYNWDICYKKLKHYRWMRNQLAHEIDIDTDFCEQNDIDWIIQFYISVLKGKDPITYAYKQQTTQNKSTSNNTVKEKPRKSLWNRIVSKIKSWFS